MRLPLYRRLYADARAGDGPPFVTRALRTLDIRLIVDGRSVPSIPRHGALIVAANHPTGLRDGLALLETMQQVRPDVRILANHLLARIPELEHTCFFVDPFGGLGAASANRAGLRAAHLWLRRGGALIVFPAGSVAPARGIDAPWHPAVVRLARATGARILPAWLDGNNSRLFYAAGRVHPGLRTVLLPRELLKLRNSVARVVIGGVIDDDAIADGSDVEAMARIRRGVESLATPASAPMPVVAPVAADVLEADIAVLPPSALLLTSGKYDVYCADATRLPHVLQEIGRLREITFRAAGEGTGAAIDLDRFDRDYEHLFVWERPKRRIVGAYRIGRTDRIVAEHGVSGLYTRTLFQYDQRVLARMGPALELGRSFVRVECQRSYNALLLLWKGIGHFVVREPRYRVLFGAVSISRRYRDISQDLLRSFLAQQHGDPVLQALVEPINPPALLPPPRHMVAPARIDELDRLIARLEGTQGIPVLLRQYLRLNATLLGFNVDPAFDDALDALMMVDLDRLPASLLRRYLPQSETGNGLDAARCARRSPSSRVFDAA
jgi:putative hemolysin